MRTLAGLYLTAYAATVSIVLGVLAMTLIANLTTATWYGSFRAQALRVLRLLPVLAAAGVLVLVAIPVLYPWTSRAALPAADVHRYLNVPFFIARFVVYWICWIVVARMATRAPRYSAAGLVILGLTMTFAAFDWMMSLTPAWASTIYGVYWFAGAMVGALALLAVLASRDPRRADSWHRDVGSLGKLLLTFVLFWLYIGFSQYIVIWSGGLPREVTWYVARTRGAWGGVAALLLFGGFGFPFLFLLTRQARRSATVVSAIGLVLIALHYVDTLWLVMPGLGVK